MRQLSAHDAAFLDAETPHSNSNLTLVQIYDQSTAPGGTVRFKSILAHIESRLGELPVFRSKLQRVPLNLDYPYWVDDPNFDLEYHVRHIALPKPGDWRQFCIQASRIHSRPLDLNRPLWEVYVVEGLDSLLELPSGSFALLTKVHQAAVDADGGNRLVTLLHDTTPLTPPPAPPRPWFPQPVPGAAALLLRCGVNSVVAPLQARTPVARRLVGSAAAAVTFATDLLQRPEQINATRFNSVVSAHRVFDTRRFPLDEFKRIRNLVPGATVDDAVLAVCSGALRRYLRSQDELPHSSLSAIVPIHARDDQPPAKTAPGQSWLRVELGTQLDGPLQRIEFIRQQTAASRAGGQALGARELSGSDHHKADAPLQPVGALRAVARVLGSRHAPSASCTITNVPGPSVPLYLNGARMTFFSAIMPISDGMGLVFAVTTYDGRVIISPTSCRELIPDPEAFTQHLRDCFQEYLALAASAVHAVPQPAPLRSARPGASAPGAKPRSGPKAGRASTAPRAAPGGRPRSAAPGR